MPRNPDSAFIIAFVAGTTPQKALDSLRAHSAPNRLFLREETTWSLDEKMKKANDYANEIRKSIPAEDKYIYSFSVPVLSKDKKIAIIEIRVKGSTYISLYKNDNGRWQKINEYGKNFTL